MWPWEHVILGYLVYSIFSHARYREPPGSGAVLAVVFASLLPDLIDKPLAWSFAVIDTGYGIGHSLFFAVPLVVAVGLVATAGGQSRVGIGFGVGYLLHPPADALYQMLGGGALPFEVFLWPLISYDGGEATRGVLWETIHRIDLYRIDLLAGELTAYMWVQLVITAVVFCLWVYDGAPVVRDGIRITRERVR
jgi:hypothetical protein